MPEGAEEGILKGMHRVREGAPGEAGAAAGQRRDPARGDGGGRPAGAGLRRAGRCLGVTSYTELRREGQECERWSRLHPLQDARRGYAETCLAATQGPVVAATDYMKTVAEQIRPFTAGRRYVTLGTDGFGRSDTRQALRAFFEVDRYHIALAALKALADDGVVPRELAADAIQRYGIDPEAVSAALP